MYLTKPSPGQLEYVSNDWLLIGVPSELLFMVFRRDLLTVLMDNSHTYMAKGDINMAKGDINMVTVHSLATI